eukprot:3765010-Pyramimonas_sp.AAC.1
MSSTFRPPLADWGHLSASSFSARTASLASRHAPSRRKTAGHPSGASIVIQIPVTCVTVACQASLFVIMPTVVNCSQLAHGKLHYCRYWHRRTCQNNK